MESDKNLSLPKQNELIVFIASSVGIVVAVVSIFIGFCVMLLAKVVIQWLVRLFGVISLLVFIASMSLLAIKVNIIIFILCNTTFLR